MRKDLMRLQHLMTKIKNPLKKVEGGEGGENVNTTEYTKDTPLSSIKGNTTRALVASSRAYQKRLEEEKQKEKNKE